jgi:hypothetical protein
MSPKDRAKTASPSHQPDCPREYHDDYIGRSARRPRGLRWLLLAGMVLAVAAGVYVMLTWA